MGRKRIVYSNFVCPECKTLISLPRKISKQRKLYHIKDIYCYKCKKVQKFVEIKSKAYKNLLNENLVDIDSIKKGDTDNEE